MERDHVFYLMLLDTLLLEIRNLEPHELAYAPKMAYMFHNIPALLTTNFTGTSGNEAFEIIRSRAAALGLTKALDTWQQSACIKRSLHMGTRTNADSS